ncbi:unnamed protein product [Dovyalis caffra]|uniref:Uncharacterized protein n=1 Tax=Dovyalis caffra TaxID=77055 RepID=A0AAV1S9Y4_9ROSI|nr:unnamed protein product [Dovyalis caffra]
MPPPSSAGGYPPARLGYYGYPPAVQPQQVERTNELVPLGGLLVAGVLGGLLIGGLASEGPAGYGAGFQDGGGDFGS